MVKVLLDENPDLVDVKNDNGETSLHLAVNARGKTSFENLKFLHLFFTKIVNNFFNAFFCGIRLQQNRC